jgi:hypothetical protein
MRGQKRLFVGSLRITLMLGLIFCFLLAGRKEPFPFRAFLLLGPFFQDLLLGRILLVIGTRLGVIAGGILLLLIGVIVIHDLVFFRRP